MERALVVQRAANKLYAAEASIDKAMADAAMLILELQSVRSDLNISATFADEATGQATASIAALAQARSAMVADGRSQAAPRHPDEAQRHWRQASAGQQQRGARPPASGRLSFIRQF